MQAAALAREVAGALDWWRQAGVDADMRDAVQDWLAANRPAPKAETAPARKAARPAPEPESPPPPALGGARDDWPATLADFAPWWLAQAGLAPAGMRRIAPSGPHGAPLMVLIDMPEADDAEGLLTGRAGGLLDSLLRAFGLGRAEVYLAAALPARIALPDWPALRAQGLGAVLERHIALAAPQRVLVFGQGWVSALLGHDSPQSAALLRCLNHEQGTTPALVTYELGFYLSKPSAKAGLWQRWLDWTGPQP